MSALKHLPLEFNPAIMLRPWTKSIRQEAMLKLALQLHTRLPRELRDKIYSYLWDDKAMYHVNDPLTLRLASPPFNAVPDCDVLHFTQIERVGELFAYEAVEWLYKSSRDLEVDVATLSKFLGLDIFRFGFTPANSQIRKLTVTMNFEGENPMLITLNRISAATIQMKNLMSLDLRKDFHLAVRLEGVPRPRRQPLLVIAGAQVEFLSEAKRIHDFLRSMVTECEKKGYKVRIWHDDNDISRQLGDQEVWISSIFT